MMHPGVLDALEKSDEREGSVDSGCKQRDERGQGGGGPRRDTVMRVQMGGSISTVRIGRAE